MDHYSSSWKNCGTCDFWSGSRRPDGFKSGVDVDQHAKGECMGKWNRQPRTANQSCDGWRKWGVLK
jgi:hypothetical protein